MVIDLTIIVWDTVSNEIIWDMRQLHTITWYLGLSIGEIPKLSEFRGKWWINSVSLSPWMKHHRFLTDIRDSGDVKIGQSENPWPSSQSLKRGHYILNIRHFQNGDILGIFSWLIYDIYLLYIWCYLRHWSAARRKFLRQGVHWSASIFSDEFTYVSINIYIYNHIYTQD